MNMYKRERARVRERESESERERERETARARARERERLSTDLITSSAGNRHISRRSIRTLTAPASCSDTIRMEYSSSSSSYYCYYSQA